MIADKERTPVDQRRLIFAAKQLESDRTLASYGIQAESRIYMMLPLGQGWKAQRFLFAFA
jgi:hypothetical protein